MVRLGDRSVGGVARSPDEEHRTATTLELLFDLCFVVAVAQASAALHDLLLDRRFADAVVGFTFAFFGIWWAWVNFVWFASGHDSDDVPYRLLTLLQMAGVLVFAAGLEDSMVDLDFTTVTIGYVVMRLGMVAMWWRVRRDQPAHRSRATRYIVGVTSLQVLWVLRLALPDEFDVSVASFAVLMVAELIGPIIAERDAPGQQFHGGHLAERFGLFTIIVLGEVILSSTLAVQVAIDAVGLEIDLLVVAGSALVIAFAVWWSYFGRDREPSFDRLHGAFGWGYSHYPVFAGLAAFGAGIHVGVETLTGEALADASERVAALAVTVPIAVTIVGFTLNILASQWPAERQLLPIAAVKVAVILLLGCLAPVAVATAGAAIMLVLGTVIQGLVLGRRVGVPAAA